MRTFLGKLLWSVVACALLAPVTLGCETDRVENFSADFRGSINPDLNDYGLLLLDAGNSECVDLARDRLIEKVRNTLALEQHLDERKEVVGPYAGWLEGAHVALIFATAMEIYGFGALDSNADGLLEQVRDAYQFRKDPNCGFAGDRWRQYNTCMDDLSVSASAYGWIAAYEHHRARDVEPFAGMAAEMISRSLDSSESVCVHTPWRESPSACNATHQDIAARTAALISLNHGQQSIPYGFGLMTSVAAAQLGLRYAQAPYELTPRERLTALALLDEARLKTDEDGQHFLRNCATNLRWEDGVWKRDDIADCGESLGYRPGMYPLLLYFEQEIGTLSIPASPAILDGRYRFDRLDASLFSFSPLAFHNAGRLATYGHLAYLWWWQPPPMPYFAKPLDDHDPVGAVTATPAGEVTGWACDPDAPTKPVRVEFFSAPDAHPASSLGYVMADREQPQSLNTQCTGANRFLVSFAPKSGERVYAFAVDATGRGMTRLAGAGESRRRPAARP